jgi:hypothetical protein
MKLVVTAPVNESLPQMTVKMSGENQRLIERGRHRALLRGYKIATLAVGRRAVQRRRSACATIALAWAISAKIIDALALSL